MFDYLGKRITGIFDRLRGKGALTESDVTTALREIRVVLLEADVALEAIKSFVEAVKTQAIGESVLKSVTPVQMIIKIVHEEIIKLLSHPEEALYLSHKGCTIYLMIGLQGSGKTSMSGKLAFLLKEQRKKVLMASLDIYRPAAQHQLELIGQSIQVNTLPIIDGQDPLSIASRAMAASVSYDILILDTAGRLHICQEMMQELCEIKNLTRPHEILFVADMLSGQDIIQVAKAFQQDIAVTGCAISRVDSDGRGGAVLSLRHCTQKPIKLMGMGELPHQVMLFDAHRIADRILDKGDVIELVNRAAKAVSQEDQKAQWSRLQKGLFTLDDLAKKIQQIETMGGVSSLLNLLPGIRSLKEKMADKVNKASFKKQLAIISSMTPKERKNPQILNASRKRRVAQGSGTCVQDINRLLQQFHHMQKMVKHMKKWHS